MNTWNQIPDQTIIEQTAQALTANGFTAVIVESAAAAKEKVLELIPEGSEVMTMTSATLDTIGISAAINESGKFNASRPKLFALDATTQKKEQKQLGMMSEYAIGSVHAVTQDGKVMIATATGSQLPAYIYGSDHVIWVAGAQKITKDLTEGMQRLEEYVLPLESERAKKAYGVPGSVISRLLINNKELIPGRTTIILVKEALGF